MLSPFFTARVNIAFLIFDLSLMYQSAHGDLQLTSVQVKKIFAASEPVTLNLLEPKFIST